MARVGVQHLWHVNHRDTCGETIGSTKSKKLCGSQMCVICYTVWCFKPVTEDPASSKILHCTIKFFNSFLSTIISGYNKCITLYKL